MMITSLFNRCAVVLKNFDTSGAMAFTQKSSEINNLRVLKERHLPPAVEKQVTFKLEKALYSLDLRGVDRPRHGYSSLSGRPMQWVREAKIHFRSLGKRAIRIKTQYFACILCRIRPYPNK